MFRVTGEPSVSDVMADSAPDIARGPLDHLRSKAMSAVQRQSGPPQRRAELRNSDADAALLHSLSRGKPWPVWRPAGVGVLWPLSACAPLRHVRTPKRRRQHGVRLRLLLLATSKSGAARTMGAGASWCDGFYVSVPPAIAR